MVVWAIHDGGYDADTWYWGALLALSGAVAVLRFGGWQRLTRSRELRIALVAFAGYVAFSYASIAWAASPGDALQGSNRALLYLLLYIVMAALPWSGAGARLALVVYALAIGTLALVFLTRLAMADGLSGILLDGRLAAPTGYYNASTALFFTGALLAIGLAAQRELWAPLRGYLIACAAAGLQLTVVGQSRGWLFTLPVVAGLTLLLLRARLRTIAAAALPTLAAVAPVHRLIAVYDAGGPRELRSAAIQAGRTGLMLCFGCFVAGTLIIWCARLLPGVEPSTRLRRLIAAAVAVVILGLGAAGTLAATNGHPVRFVSRQWSGFSHPPTADASGSHFATIGSARYDFWRVSLDALSVHPAGGLGQDNFVEYYLPRRHSAEEPSWTHSLEMRLLASTGLVGFALFAGFVLAALTAAVRARRGPPAVAALAGIALLPLVTWLVQGSVDWFWELPALAGPALGFLGVATALAPVPAEPDLVSGSGARRALGVAAGAAVLLAAVAALAFPYLSVREVSRASDEQATSPGRALSDLQTAAELNPLSADPDRLAGAIALRAGLPNVAATRFRRATDRDPGGWLGWFGAGLAASALGDQVQAQRDLETAHRINLVQPAVRAALARVASPRPLTPRQALNLLRVVK